MNAAICSKDQHIIVSGTLNFETVTQLFNQSLELIKNQSVIRIDLSKVTQANSAGLSLLVEWLRYAKQKTRAIHFENVPQHLLSIAAVAGVAKIF